MADKNEEKSEVLVTEEEALELDITEQLDQPTANIPDTEENEQAAPAEYEIVGIRFKKSGKIYYFDPSGNQLKAGDNAIVETARGIEYGSVALSNRMVGENDVVLPLRKVLRAATPEDEKHHEENIQREKEAFSLCAAKITDHKLDMKLIDVEYTFDNNKLLFYFTADGRIDFRELVKDLASVFRTRIELRQIGIRDEAKLLGGLGICGRPFCCSSFLGDFVQVSIKMAKDQNLSLNSAKISGACGRLMCCLRYEYDTYEEELKKTPRMDSTVRTPDGDGKVVEVRPLAEQVKVRLFKDPDQPKVYHRDSVSLKLAGKDEDNSSEEELRSLTDKLEADAATNNTNKEKNKPESVEGKQPRPDRKRGTSKRPSPQVEKTEEQKEKTAQEKMPEKPTEAATDGGESKGGEVKQENHRRSRGSRGGRSRQKNRSGEKSENRPAQEGDKPRKPQQNQKNQNSDGNQTAPESDKPRPHNNNRRRGPRRGHNGGNGGTPSGNKNGGTPPTEQK